MNPSYFRIRLHKEEAIERLCKWNQEEPKERIETEFSQAVDVCLDENGEWKGACLYVYENDGWTIFEDLSGGYSAIPAEEWKEFAKKDDLIVVGYNDAIIYAEMVVISNGIILKEFMEDRDNPEEDVNKGDSPEGIASWIDIAEFMEEDELVFSDQGTVLIL